ncbi:MAG: DUF4440 domain-containing protein [Holophagales bacterium]|nr:DUF4440 domain-containing protein [Holophagales bacterium]
MSRDEEEIGALIAEVYEVISGPAGERDWERFRSLFAHGARLMPARRRERGQTLEVLSPEEYAATRAPLFRQSPFFEREVARELGIFGDIAHAWSAYAGRFSVDGPEALRGLNSFQFHRGDDGWRIVSLLWDTERPGVEWPGPLFETRRVAASRARKAAQEKKR